MSVPARASRSTALEPKDRLDEDLHDIANALSAARSYSDVLLLRARAQTPADPAIVESLIRELERLSGILKDLRRETYQKGDVLKCLACGYTWVHRKAFGKRAICRRCNGSDVERWRPANE